MANNITVKDAFGNNVVLSTTDPGTGIQQPNHNVLSIINPLPTGTNVVGKIGIQVGGSDVSGSNTVPVTQTGALPTGTNVVGKVGIQVGGSDLATNNPIPVVPELGNNSISASNPMPGILVDPVTSTNKATVAAFHNADNTILPINSFGLNTGGVAQLLNQVGNIDRQRETSFDNIPASGVATGTAQLAGPLMSTTGNNGASIVGSASPQVVILTAVSFTFRGVTFTYQAGTTLIVESGGANQEFVYVTAVNVAGKTVTGIFTKNHTSSVSVSGFAYNQARDASVLDGASPAGIAANATYLWNPNLNGGTGGVEIERSAAGELNGAAGTGFNSAAEYESNSGGPPNSSGVATLATFDQSRNIHGKGRGSSTLNGSVTQGGTSLTLNAAAGLVPGTQVVIDRSGTIELNYVAASYTTGSTTVPLALPLAASHGNGLAVEWDIFLANGPKLTGFLPSGVGVEEECVYDPVTDLFYLERAATQDAMPTTNVVAQGPALFNGTTMDRQRSAAGTTGVAAANTEGTKATYSYSSISNTPAAAATDILTITGSGSKTVRITKIVVTGNATAQAAFSMLLVRRSTADSGGTSSTPAALKYDTSDGAATAVVTLYTANPASLGTTVGTVKAFRVPLVINTFAAPGIQTVVFDFTTRNEKGLVLRGTSDILAINGNAGTISAGGVLDFDVTWTEE